MFNEFDFKCSESGSWFSVFRYFVFELMLVFGRCVTYLILLAQYVVYTSHSVDAMDIIDLESPKRLTSF